MEKQGCFSSFDKKKQPQSDRNPARQLLWNQSLILDHKTMGATTQHGIPFPAMGLKLEFMIKMLRFKPPEPQKFGH